MKILKVKRKREMKQERVVEVCCGSYYDAIQAYNGGAKRIELNSALFLGGLTPSTATLRMVRKECPSLQIIAMVRPRGAGFCYSEEECSVMEEEAKELLETGADGIAFGFLDKKGNIQKELTGKFVALIHSYGKEAVFHRAFDCVNDPDESLQKLIELKVDRVLTSGLSPTAIEGVKKIAFLQKKYGEKIQILAGSGINEKNAGKLIEDTGIFQVHSSCKEWKEDPTTIKNGVSYGYTKNPGETMYDVVSEDLVKKLIMAVEK